MQFDFQVPVVNKVESNLLQEAAMSIGFSASCLGGKAIAIPFYNNLVLLFNISNKVISHNSRTYSYDEAARCNLGPYGQVITASEMFAKLCEPPVPQIKIGNYVVKFECDKIKVGCTTVSNDTVKAIYEQIFTKLGE